jgi:CheY-like chemotaxis protein
LAHILVVDDHEMVRQVVGLILERAGHRVSEACDGEHALEVLQSVTPDMVLTDTDMAVIDGKWFLAELRSRFPGMPCAGMSWDSEGIEFDGFIHKPFDIQELVKMIGRVLERRSVEE